MNKSLHQLRKKARKSVFRSNVAKRPIYYFSTLMILQAAPVAVTITVRIPFSSTSQLQVVKIKDQLLRTQDNICSHFLK